MKIFIVCSKAFYPRVEEIKKWLEEKGCEIILPNSYDNPGQEQEMKDIGAKEHADWRAGMLRDELLAMQPAVINGDLEKISLTKTK